ncbi:larval cuticle protein A2B-like [Wyeomyia smithii]|uniref:larval cuticle protein A2B-like n=1 Tax=Wyeomyia smithii TaxID=174621 RepID=UPI002467B182|nr:larval cuticle protein A2B-like [Wyeomyia smithii]
MVFKFLLAVTCLAFVGVRSLPQHGYATSHLISNIQHTAPAYHHIAPIQHVSAIHAAPVHHTILKQVETHAPANYEFSYSVHDGHTGDIKSQHESRHGDEVHGQYSLLDADGHKRIVDYHADHHNGFNAVVRREPTGVKVIQPVQKLIAQPIHVAPLAHASYSAAPLIHSHHNIAPIAYHSQGHQATSYSSIHHY